MGEPPLNEDLYEYDDDEDEGGIFHPSQRDPTGQRIDRHHKETFRQQEPSNHNSNIHVRAKHSCPRVGEEGKPTFSILKLEKTEKNLNWSKDDDV